MLKVRVMPTLLFKNFGLVKGVGFDSWRQIGNALQAVQVYNMREVDELIFLDITATRETRSPDFELIDEIADECFMPLTVGGGIQSIEDVQRLLQVGADKVCINSAAYENPGLIREAADYFGSQCVVVSIDAREVARGYYGCFSHNGSRKTQKEVTAWAQEIESLGAGEILITSIERDGTMQGYDLELIRQVSESVCIPVIASGGAGSYQHMYEAISMANANAVAASSMFHFTEQTPLEAKRFLAERGIPIRSMGVAA
jgi:imidazole glycerol-phosphate synthase subunit HisF